MKHRLVAPRGVAGAVELTGGVTIEIPPSGIVEIGDRPEVRPVPLNAVHLRELLALGFQHAPDAGGIAERGPGRFEGEQFFDEYLGKPLWWSQGAWRDAMGRVA